jgi:crotonobetainyl-CoA:carnitine CoA-transferase CaiB-like acyl-CoA transferase
MFIKWNRGKRSLALDLKTAGGQAVFKELVVKSDVVIEGLRAGTLERWGLGYERLIEINPELVFCSLSGWGNSGPYKNLAIHGQNFDAYAGYMPPRFREDGTVRAGREHATQAGLNASGLWAAMGVVSALLAARRTGKGAFLDVAEVEVSAYWNWQAIEASLNQEKVYRRRSYGKPSEDSVRHNFYETKDGRFIQFMATEAKFWDRFLRAIGREDLKETYPPKYGYDHQVGQEGLRRELVAIFKQKTQAEWMQFNLDYNIAAGPVNAPQEIPFDRHFKARHNVHMVEQPETGPLKLLTTPVKIGGETFEAKPAPSLGADSVTVLQEILGYDARRISELVDSGVVGTDGSIDA